MYYNPWKEDRYGGNDEDHEMCGKHFTFLHRFINFLHRCTKGNWTCEAGRFDCGNTDPKCISKTQICNEYADCSDGSDEASQLCGQLQV